MTIGYEALIRWKHPQRGLIPPTEFIPVAEETGMITLIGDWVLRRACADASHLPGDCVVAVNISPVQFGSRDFVQRVREIVSETGIDPNRLELEVTETAMMLDRQRAAAILCELSDMGISVAVDDFGTGYSNLSYLIDFRFKKLKIDRSFVARMETDGNSGAVVSTIVGLSRALGCSHHRRGRGDRRSGHASAGGGMRRCSGIPLRQTPAARPRHSRMIEEAQAACTEYPFDAEAASLPRRATLN
jgi:EAL domain-containing protein (putative c-di-GMP-specific phosphodiesterase class I)